jgi:hypothetical protein
VQRIKADWGRENLDGELLKLFVESSREDQREKSSWCLLRLGSLDVNGLAERHKLSLLSMALPKLADVGGVCRGLMPLQAAYDVHTILHANDLHMAKPVSGAQLGRTRVFSVARQSSVCFSALAERGTCTSWIRHSHRPN